MFASTPTTSEQTAKKTAKKLTIFALGGRTGGPLVPILAIIQGLSKELESRQQESEPLDLQVILLGVAPSFEADLAKKNNWPLELLPEVKFSLGSFKNLGWLDKLRELFKLIWSCFLLLFSLLKSLQILLKYKPQLILSTGSFLAVPVLWTAKVTNLLRLTKAKIVIHQQDPYPGLANKLTSCLADKLTCVFGYTRQGFRSFKRAEMIPNPIDTERFDTCLQNFFASATWRTLVTNTSIDAVVIPKGIVEWQETNYNLELVKFLKTYLDRANIYLNSKAGIKEKTWGKELTVVGAKYKPLLLVFGGGSGSQFINHWLWQNLSDLSQHFLIVHLVGVLQDKKEWAKVPQNHPNYLALESLFTEMPLVLTLADLVLCRAGLGSITELLYLQKPAFLVPLPNSHQEINAKVVSKYFYVLQQIDSDNWLDQILSNYPKFFQSIDYPARTEIKGKLKKYYRDLAELLK